MALGTLGQWRKARCAGRYRFLCEKEVTESLPSMDNYLTGLVVMTGVFARVQMYPLSTVPDIGQITVEMQLFSGLWFSHAGQLASVELVVQPSPLTSTARVQILRPYCNPNHHLVPPGGCSVGQYWCHLLEACVPTTSPCSPYDSAAAGRGFVLPPRYTSTPPFYHLVADLPLRINPNSEVETINVVLPERAIMVYPDDIVAIQHTRDSGTFLHCLNSDASLNSHWRQSYLSLWGTEWGGWWEGGLTSLPKGGQWVDGVVCDLRMLYVDTLHRATEHEDIFGSTNTETTTRSDIRTLTTAPTPSLTSKFKLTVVHPLLDEKNQIHVQINVPTLIVVKVLSGKKATSSWSTPVHQTGLPFLPSCPEEVIQSSPGCERQSSNVWFSSVTLVLPSEGVQMMNISVTDAVSSQGVSVKVCGYTTVTGLSVEPHGHLRMLVDAPQLFIAKVESGSSVIFTWVIDNLESFAYEGESYSVVFKKPAEYKLRVTASNPVSSQSQQILLTADEMTPLAEPEFLDVREVVAVDVPHLYTFSVKVDISLPVTFRWDFGDGSSNVIHTQSAPCQTMEGLLKRGEKQVYIQDSVNYTYSIPDDYTLHVQVSNQYDNIDKSTKIAIRPQLDHLLVSAYPLVPLVSQTLHLEASTEPSTDTIFYTWDFNDGSEAVQGIHRSVRHTFALAGVYNITLRANNTLTSLTTWLMVEVMEKISGLAVSHNGPSKLGSATDFRAKVASGTSLIWDFDFGDGSLQRNLTDGSITHIYKSPGNYTVGVTVSNYVSQTHQSICVEVYRLTVSGVLPTECFMSGRNTQLTALVNGNISIFAFHWLFGDGSPLTVVTGQSTAMHTFVSQGVFHVSLTVVSSVTSVSYNSSICVETPITDIVMKSSQDVVAVGEEVCFRAIVSPEQTTGYQFKWFNNASMHAAMTENVCFAFKEDGVEEVSVTASNKVSNKTAKTSITVQEPVGMFSVVHDSQSDTVTVNTLASFWVASCTGSNVSVIWDFGDGSPAEQEQNVSHIFTLTGQFTVTATAFNAVSKDSATIRLNVLLPVSDLSLHTNQSYSVVGEETLITAVSSAISSTNYYWTVEGITTAKQGTYQFRFAFPKPGVYQVKVIAQNLVSRKEAAILIEIFERIEGLHIEGQNLTNMKYVPTQEKLLFSALISKGSNVTYHWLVTQCGINQQITGDGELFHLLVETPGEYSVQLRASNKLGETTSTVSIVAVEHVTSATMTTLSNTVAAGKLVNISVSVVSGSDLQYLWYVDTNLSPLQTHVPFFLHTFTSLGHCLIKVSVQNILSQSNDTQKFIVQEEVEEVSFRINSKKHPFYINSSAAVYFIGLIHKGSDLHWDWTVRGPKTNIFNTTNHTFLYTFPHEGVYQVSLNVSNAINWQMVLHSVTVQDEIEDKDLIHSQDVIGGQFNTSSLPAGTHQVTVKAWNQVSSAEVSSSLLVTERIQGLRLVNCCSAALEALNEIHFKAEVQSGFSVNYTWIFHLVESKPTWLMGQEVIFTPPESGSLFVSVRASNGVCSKTLNETATVEWPVKKVELVCHSERIFVGYAVKFSANVNGVTNLKYLWDFGDSTEALVKDLNTVIHTYYTAGKYTVTIKVSNSVSHVSKQLRIEVEELMCSSPGAFLLQSQFTIFRSRQSFFEANVDINCSAYKTTYLWEMFRGPDCTNSNLDFHGNRVILNNATSPFLLLPKHSLSVGQYCVVFTVSLHRTPLHVQRKTKVTVVHSPLVAAIKGGSHRVWPSFSDLVLDGSESQDPDVEPGVEDALQYHWTYMTANFERQPIGSNSSRLIVPSTQLHPGTVYVFTLTVHKAERRPASVTQAVSVCAAPVLSVNVECLSCSVLSSSHRIGYTTPIILSGQCEQCDDQTQYKWGAEDQTGMSLDLDEFSTSTGRFSSNLVVRSDVLQPGQSYTFTLNVTEPGRGRWGSASLTLLINNPPHGGRCELSPESNIRPLETVVTYNCSGWQDDESEASQLFYTFQVAPCQPTSTMCPVFTLYRGTRPTFGSLVPVGSPVRERNMSAITVTLLVEDHLGAKVIALNKTLTVENPARDKVASQWLRNKSQTELWALVQHGNPQEIIPYSIALTRQLNQMESGRSAIDISTRREIRENVTQTLASLPISSLQDVDQISTALAQSTAVPSELACDSCQEKVLEAVAKMIHVMEEQMSLGVLSAFDTGRNILNIIGSTLAAVSESVSVSNSSPDDSSTPQSASVIALSALDHAGALMRSLMRSHVHGEVPLSLSTPYISTAGFHGNPSDLLCTQQSNMSNQQQITPFLSSPTDGLKSSRTCPFHIPTSLITHLKSQTSEVVQVLYGMDGALESNPLLTAADPPISTTLVAMELTTPQGQSIPIQDLGPEQGIQVTLPNKYDAGGDGRVDEDGNGTCLTVALPSEGRLDFTVKAVDGLDENAGLYISFNFSLTQGATPVSLGHVKIEVSSSVPGTNASQDSLVRAWALSLSAPATSTEETIFLSPLLNQTDKPLSVSLTSSLGDGGPVRVSVCVFSSLCQYYSVKERRWSSEGLQPLEGSTLHEAHCLTQHLTMFGASLFVHPGAVVLLPPVCENTKHYTSCYLLRCAHLINT
ncbi:hypothetical protein PAMA_012795 [Pampus argenteus]